MKKIILLIFALILGFFNIAFGYSSSSADLEISDITYDSDAGKLKVKIYNRGTQNLSRSFRIKIETSGETNYYYVDKNISSKNSITLSYDIDNFSIDGERAYIKAEVDIDDDVDESDESNNTYSDYVYFEYYYHEGYDEDLPDLRVRDAIYSSADEELKIQISNDGEGDLNEKFRIKVELANKTYYYYFNSFLKANNSKRINVNVSDSSIKRSGTYKAKIILDCDDDIDESSKSNNTYYKSIYFYRSSNDDYSENDNRDDDDYDGYYNRDCYYYDSYYCKKNYGLPDLKVGSISYKSADEELSIRIDNKGTKYVDQKFKIKIEVNGHNYYYYYDEKINAGTYKRINIDIDEFDIYKTGTYNVRVRLDVNGDVKESDNSNNSLTSSIYFNLGDDDDDDDDDDWDKNKDIYVSQIDYDDDDEELIIKIRNKGSNDIKERFKIRIEIDGYNYYFYIDTDIRGNDYIEYRIDIDKFNIRQNKNYDIKIRLDINNNISEDDENNNDYSENLYIND